MRWAATAAYRTVMVKLQADSWLSGILATEAMVLCLACFENQGQQKLYIGFGKFVWPDTGDIDSVERLCVVKNLRYSSNRK